MQFLKSIGDWNSMKVVFVHRLVNNYNNNNNNYSNNNKNSCYVFCRVV